MECNRYSAIWYPCSQMKDYERFPPKKIVKAAGSFLYLEGNQPVIDAISSWWCKSLGHGHPVLKSALKEQLERFEHVIMANTVSDVLVALTEKLTRFFQAPYKVFYAGDGSCAVEVALKMSLHARQIQGENRFRYVALKNGYHGETVGALSVSDCGLYAEPYRKLYFDCDFCDVPYVHSTSDPQWLDASGFWQKTEEKLAPIAHEITAFIIEPIVQGAGGMLLYSADYLRLLSKYCQDNNIHLIADEIMTGCYRTGKRFACDYADIEPDILCLSKGLTSGFLPMSAVVVKQSIYDVFYDDYETGKAFLHSHTYSGNALAASVALATLKIMEAEPFQSHLAQLSERLMTNLNAVANQSGLLTNVRGIGGLVAADLITKEKRLGYQIFQKAIEEGAWLRPLGNTLYWMPPLNTPLSVLDDLANITLRAMS